MRISADKINWRVAIGEMVLIVLGILMALAIDSYADRRADHEQANVYLRDLVTELQADKLLFEKRSERVADLIDSASRLLQQVEGKGQATDDPGVLLMNSVTGEGVTSEPAIWVEIQMTGTLRLIPNPAMRTAIVGYYLNRASWSKTVEENFVPAVRDLRSLAWDILPVESFTDFFQSLRSGSKASSGVPGATVLASLTDRADTIYLLKRVIVTGTVAHRNLNRASEQTATLIAELSKNSQW